MRNPDVAAAVRQERTVTAAQDIPLLPTVLSRIRLARLDDTESGDVFYLVSDPSRVWLRYDGALWADDYPFMEMGDEVWRSLGRVGTGLPDQTVVVLHNTKKFGVR